MLHREHRKKHHRISTFAFTGNVFFLWFDIVLIIISFFALLANFFQIGSANLTVVTLIAVALIGFVPVFASAIKSLFSRRLTIDLLASIALAFSFFSHEWRSAVFISLMLASARLLAQYTDSRARLAIQSLLKLCPETVHIKDGGQIIEKHIKDVKIGDLVVVDNGERIAADGVVVSGSASIDQSSLTGEFIPVTKTVGDEVLSSTLNVSGSLVVETTKIGEDTTFAKTIKLIEESQQSKAPIGSIAEKFISWYILLTLVGSLVFYLSFHNLNKVLSILLVTCADDLAIAIPLAFLAAISVAAKNGIIIKGANYLEGFTKVKAIIFDKTGTITEGKPKVRNTVAFGNNSESDLLKILGAAMLKSNHPVSKAIYQFAREKNIQCSDIVQVDEKPGFGVKGMVDGKWIYGGNLKFLENNGIEFSDGEIAAIEKEKSLGRIITILGIEKKAIGFISLSDTVRSHVAQVMDDFKKMGIEKIVMLTGDNEVVASQVAQEAHIPEFRANLLPQDKVNFLKGILNKNYKTVMVGDGINDAAALSAADIGVAMGAIGSDAAIESSDIALMKDNLENIGGIIKLGRRSMRVVKQDFVLWGILNGLGLILVFINVLGPSGAAAYNFATDFIPLINSLKIFRFRFGKERTKKLLF
ncbi:MAG: cation-translocating P-type ATPase [Patescibacteria group bacterium]